MTHIQIRFIPTFTARLGATLLFCLAGVLGCDTPVVNELTNPPPSGKLVSTSASHSQTVSNRGNAFPMRRPDSILIASFNIQVFGEKKLQTPGIPERIASVIQQFDVVAIQEIRSDDQSLLTRLMRYVNANGARYDYILGPRLGRTVSKEQYAYIFDTTRVVTNLNASYTVDDSQDMLEREPFVARFVTRVPSNMRPFSFTLVDLHTTPKEAKQEMVVMDTVFKSIQEFEFMSTHEDDIMLLGDLNAAPSEFPKLARRAGIHCAIADGQPTNTARNKTYDNIVFDQELTNEFTGNSGVLNLCDFLSINKDDALLISDHFPVWAEFSITERVVGDQGFSNTASRTNLNPSR